MHPSLYSFDVQQNRITDQKIQAGQWIVVTAPAFRDSLVPLCEHRSAQGLKVIVIETTEILTNEQIQNGEAIALRNHIQNLCNHVGILRLLMVSLRY